MIRIETTCIYKQHIKENVFSEFSEYMVFYQYPQNILKTSEGNSIKFVKWATEISFTLNPSTDFLLKFISILK